LIFEGEITDLPDREAELLAAQNARLALRQQLPQVCNGVPAPSTAPYTGNTVVIAYNTVSLRVHPQNNALGEFTSSELENINLVACIEAEEISQIQECFYNGPSIFRFARTANVTLRIAQTGEVLVSGVLFGPAPRECRQSEPYNLTRLTGGAMEGTELVRWLPIFVHP
jgi:hypothetical protein